MSRQWMNFASTLASVIGVFSRTAMAIGVWAGVTIVFGQPPANSLSTPPVAEQTPGTSKARDPGSTRQETEYWYDYENIFDDVVKNKESVANAAPMPVKVNDLEFRKIYETPTGPKWSSWAQAYVAESGALNVVFKVIEGGPADLPADYKWQYIGPKALSESGVKRNYRHLESTDNGQTWRNVAVYDASDLATPILLPALSLGKGALLGVGGMWDGWDHDRNSYDLVGTLMTAISHDNGKTWENRQTLNDPATKDRLVWCHPALLRDGAIVLPAYGTDTKIGSLPNGATEPAAFDAYLFFSDDEGRSWSKQILIAKGTPTLSMEEPAVAELENGDLLVILRHTNPSKAGSNDVYVNCGQIIVRKVEGKWIPGPLMRTHLGFRGMPALLRTRDGVLICAGSGNQFNFSVDDGKNWSATQVSADPAYNRHNHYPVMVELSDGHVMSIYHLGNDLPYPPPEPEWIHSTSFKLSRP